MFDVTPQDIRNAAFGIKVPTGTVADVQLAALIEKAKNRLVPGIVSLTRRVEAGTLEEQTVNGVIEDMVLRVVKNPRSLRQLGIDDFQTTIDSAVSTGALYLSDYERELLAPKTRGALGSIRIGVPSYRLPGA